MLEGGEGGWVEESGRHKVWNDMAESELTGEGNGEGLTLGVIECRLYRGGEGEGELFLRRCCVSARWGRGEYRRCGMGDRQAGEIGDGGRVWRRDHVLWGRRGV